LQKPHLSWATDICFDALFQFFQESDMTEAVSRTSTAPPAAEQASTPAAASAAPASFDFGSEAELFPTRARKGRRQPLSYRRFARAADAIQFAMEALPANMLLGTYLEVDEQRYAGDAIRQLYERADYPLQRTRPAQ
jgi:hypothetical protein